MPKAIESGESAPQSGYQPEEPVQGRHPVFQWPPQPAMILKWLFGFPGYLWPWPVFFLSLALVSWFFLTPDMDKMKNFSAGWISLLFCENLLLLILFVGAWHVRLYIQKAQGTNYKYNSKWLSAGNPTFMFRNQLWDNVLWNICSAVPIWTAYEALTFWLQANGFAPTVSWETRPMYCVLLVLLMPLWMDVHFYTIHRLIHWPPLYRSVHYLHHKNINFGPWSGLAMHPVEHFLYFSGVILLWIIPSHPVHSLFLLQNLALGASLAHLGFGRLVLSNKIYLGTEDYMHYLHHKYVSANFGVDVVPLDRWLGTFHDGSDNGHEAMKRRLRAQNKRHRP